MFRFNRTPEQKQLVLDKVALKSAHYFYDLVKREFEGRTSNLNETLRQLDVISCLDVDLSYIRDHTSELDLDAYKYVTNKLKEADELIDKRLEEANLKRK